MTPILTVRETACAKVNLYLRVGGRRPDGFHDILTLMRRVSLSDTLVCRFCKADVTRVTVTTEGGDAPLPADARNLAAIGILAVLDAAGETAEVSVCLQKNIPTAAGLGGGSSDAAAAMRAANRFLGGRFTDAELERLAASVGSDVPFFITGRTAVCSGRGECLVPVSSAFEGGCVILAGREPSATAAAYAALDAAREAAGKNACPKDVSALSDNREEEQSRASESDLHLALHPDLSHFMPGDLHNDFEAPVSLLCPSVPLHLAALRAAGAVSVAMSGSGSAAFGLFATPAEAEKAAASLTDAGYTAFAAVLL